MSAGRLWRRVGIPLVIFVLVFGATSAVIWLVRGNGPDVADVADGALGVDDVVRLQNAEPTDVIVTGYLFSGRSRTILCSGRDDEDPPYCDGVAVVVERLDASRIDYVVPDEAPAWSRDEVTLAGEYHLGVLTVREILQ